MLKKLEMEVMSTGVWYPIVDWENEVMILLSCCETLLDGLTTLTQVYTILGW